MAHLINCRVTDQESHVIQGQTVWESYSMWFEAYWLSLLRIIWLSDLSLITFAFGGLLNEGKVWETAVKAMGLGWDYDYVVLVYRCQPWQVLMSTKPGTVLMVDVFRSGLARVSLHFLNMFLRQCQLHLTPKMDLSSSRTLDVCIPRETEFFVLDLYSFNSWKNMPVKGKQSFLDTKELGWSQQHFVMELFFVEIH